MRCIAIEEAFLTDSLAEALLALPDDVAATDRDLRQLRMMVGAIPRFRTILTDIYDHRLKRMDDAGVDMALLSLMAPGVQSFQTEQAIELAQDANDQLAEVVARRPDRFGGLACFAPHDPEAAALEIERAVGSLGMHGVLVNSHTHGEYLDHVRYTPIFEVLEARGIPLYLHPRCPPHMAFPLLVCSGPASEGAQPGALQDGHPRISEAFWGFHMEASLHVARLIVTGVFERHPGLRVVLGHLGEGVPLVLERMDWAGRLGFGLARPPSETFREHFYVTTSGLMNHELGHKSLRFCIDVMGPSRVLFAADYPFGSMEETRAAVMGAGLDDATLAKVLHGNAESLYGIPRLAS